MSFDLEKGAGASIQQPTTARVSNHADFPPTYEQHVNDNMRRFSDDFHEVKLREFDGIQDPKPDQRKRKCPTWVWFTVGVSILIIVAAMLGGLIIHYTNKPGEHSDESSIKTRSYQTTTISPLTTTIFVTEIPPTTSTEVIMTTVTPSTSSPSIITVTSTTTASTSESSTTPSTTSTSTITTAPEPTTTSMSPSEAALRSSIAAAISRNSEKLIPSPITTPITTTLISVTTATSVSISTPPREPDPTLIDMPGGVIDWCGVPGTNC